MQNFEETIISQFGNSPRIIQLITNFNGYIDPSTQIDAFYDMLWNVDTAVGYGLDVWGRIVGVSRVLQVAQGKYFGYEEATNVSADPYNTSPFYSGAATTSNFALSDDAFRTLIFAKALANICDGSIPAINKILLNLFPNRGNCYVEDNGNMAMTYKFNFSLTPVESAIVSQSGILPKPAGVSVNLLIGNGTISLSGPSGGVAGVASQLITVTATGVIPGGTVLVTMEDGGCWWHVCAACGKPDYGCDIRAGKLYADAY